VTGKPVTDVYVLRIEQIASSPGTPYRDFPVEYMFPENLAMQLIGGSGAEATAIRLVFIAFVAIWPRPRPCGGDGVDDRLPSISCWACRCCRSCISGSTSCRSRFATWGVALVERREDDVGGGIALGSAVILSSGRWRSRR
jgi:hypothetical protein